MRSDAARRSLDQPEFGRVDAWLERVYARLGWRVLMIYLYVAWLFGLLLGIVGALLIGHVERLGAGATLELLGLIFVFWVASSSIGFLITRYQVRPLRDWFKAGRDPTGAATTWPHLCRLPMRISLAQYLVAVTVAIPGLVVSSLLTLPDPEPAYFIVLVVAANAPIAITACVGVFGLQLLLRPILRDIGASLQDSPMPEGGTTVRLKLFVAVPVIALAAALVGSLMSIDPGVAWSEPAANIGLLFLGLVVLLPAGALLAHSTLQPLDDLLRATERLKRGDFESRVPELSGDEYGVLARSFNEAMEGLAERQRLAAANEDLLKEVRASRARIVASSDAERRRVERNLHDGAQQRLVSLALDLQDIAELAERVGSAELIAAAEEARETVRLTLAELRELARGLHPAVLTTDGLAPALRQLAGRMRLSVTIEADQRRLPEQLESAAYFVASEALANVAKYAEASRVEITVSRRNGRLVVEIRDDGVGGAHAEAGSGLAGLADRVAALDGKLVVQSPSGEGTTVSAELPL